MLTTLKNIIKMSSGNWDHLRILLNYKLAHQAIFSSIPGSLFLSVTFSLIEFRQLSSSFLISVWSSWWQVPRIDLAFMPKGLLILRPSNKNVKKKIVNESKVHLFLAECGRCVTWKVKVHCFFFRFGLREVRPCLVGDFNKTIIPLAVVGQTWL